MTGFGRSVFSCENFDLSIDAYSVNKRGLEVNVYLPRDWQSLEQELLAKVKNFFTRGKVQVTFKLTNKQVAQSFLDKSTISGALKNLAQIALDNGLEFKPSADTILKISEIFKSECSINLEEHKENVVNVFLETLAKLDEMRVAEGLALKKDTFERLDLLSEYLEEIEIHSQQSVEKYRESLMQRLKSLDLELNLADERLLKEITLFADKCDVSEEKTRIKSHLLQFKETFEEAQAVGRKLDFLCQELGREINTISSKANNVELTKVTILFKNELERIREQIQNIE